MSTPSTTISNENDFPLTFSHSTHVGDLTTFTGRSLFINKGERKNTKEATFTCYVENTGCPADTFSRNVRRNIRSCVFFYLLNKLFVCFSSNLIRYFFITAVLADSKKKSSKLNKWGDAYMERSGCLLKVNSDATERIKNGMIDNSHNHRLSMGRMAPERRITADARTKRVSISRLNTESHQIRIRNFIYIYIIKTS